MIKSVVLAIAAFTLAPGISLGASDSEWLALDNLPPWLASAEINLPRLRMDPVSTGEYQFWVRTTPKAVKGKVAPHGYAMTLYRGDCRAKQLTMVSIAEYEKSGAPISQDSRYRPPEPVPPHSFAERLLETVCSLPKKPHNTCVSKLGPGFVCTDP